MDESRSPGIGRPSRRGLLLATGGAVVGSVASTGSAAGSSGTDSRERVTVSRDRGLPSPPAALEEVVGADVAVSTTDRDLVDGIERFTAGETDVLHARRPLLPGELRAVENEVLPVRFESVAGSALLKQTGTWRRTLQDDELRGLHESNPRTETWAELAVEDVPEPDEFEGIAVDDPPRSDAEVVARGVRADQYARGQGGLGHYRVPSEDLVPVGSVDADATATPLVQLRYTYVDAESLGRRELDRYRGLMAGDAG